MKQVPHTVRHKDGGTVSINHMTKNLAIKLMCTECMGWEGGIRRGKEGGCSSSMCPLFPYRGWSLLGISKRKDPRFFGQLDADTEGLHK